MKRAQLLSFLMVLMFGFSKGQSIGDHFNYIKSKRPGGDFEKSENNNNRYFYHWSDEKAHWAYVFDLNLICEGIMIHPKSSESRSYLIRAFEDDVDWIKIDEKTWKYYRDDGKILIAELRYIEEVGPTIIIRKIE